MNSTKILVILLAVLGSLSAWYFLIRDDSTGSNMRGTDGKEIGWDRKFALEDVSEVHRIFLARRDGTTTDLIRERDGWRVNGEYRANQNIINNLLKVIGRVEMQSQPSKGAVETMVKDLSTRGIFVQLFDKNGKQLRGYTIGGTTPDEHGTYMIMEGSNQPYVVQLPFFTGALRTRFAHVGDEWRDKRIYVEDPNEIASVSVDYPKQRNRSFILKRQGERDFSVDPLYETTPRSQKPLSVSAAQSYLTAFASVFGEGFEADHPRLQERLAEVPFAVIELTRRDGSVRRIAYHPVDNVDAYGNKMSDIFERSFLEIDERNGDTVRKDYMSAQFRVIQEVFRGYDYFYD